MNFKILVLLLFYWCVWLLIVATAGGTILSGAGFSTTGGNISTFSGSTSMINQSGVFGIIGGVSNIGDFAMFALFGIGFTGAPAWFAVMFSIWQTAITVITIGFLISIVWNG